MRERYFRQLQSVYDDLVRMGSRVEHNLSNSMQALATLDRGLAQRVIAEDAHIDASRNSIEENVLQLLSIQQPVLATDLRRLNATIAIANELERAGDYTKGISRRVIRCLQAPSLVEVPGKLLRMGEITQRMLRTSLDSFVRQDVELARSLAAEDETIDSLEDSVSIDLLNSVRTDPGRLDCTIALLDVAHTLERLADRTTNIAERVIFIATSTNEELNK